MTLSVRPASIEDSATIATLVGELGYPATEGNIASWLSHLLGSDRYLVAVATGSAGGLLGLVNAERRLTIESGTFHELTGLVVASSARRAGIGSALVAAAEAWALSNGATALRVRSNVVRPEAHSFYARLGYDLRKTQHCYSKPLCGSASAHAQGASATPEAAPRLLNDGYWNPLVPELTVTDLEASLRFYVAAGFSVRFRRTDPPFAYLELGQAQIMLEEQHVGGWGIEPLDRPLGRGINLQIEVADVRKTLDALTGIGFMPFRDLKETWYPVSETIEEGQREFLVQDPDGYLMRFAQPLGRRC